MHRLLVGGPRTQSRRCRSRDGTVQSIQTKKRAERVGYGSASTFSVAFTRTVGVPPSLYGRAGSAVSL